MLQLYETERREEALMDFINFISASLLSGVDELNRDLSSLCLSADKSSQDPQCEPWEWLSECLTGEPTMRSLQNMRGTVSSGLAGCF